MESTKPKEIYQFSTSCHCISTIFVDERDSQTYFLTDIINHALGRARLLEVANCVAPVFLPDFKLIDIVM